MGSPPPRDSSHVLACAQVTNGKNAMPAFGGRLSDEEIGDIAAYVIDQANGDKWDD